MGTALEFVDKVLNPFEGPDVVVRNAITAHGFLQNDVTITISNLLFHVLMLFCLAVQRRALGATLFCQLPGNGPHISLQFEQRYP
jgi:hypothetical protein